jgi:hypothetical protein
VPGRDEVFVYTVFVKWEGSTEQTWPIRSVVVQDLATGRLIGNWKYSGRDLGYPIGAVVGKEHVVVATHSSLTRYNLDGSGERLLFQLRAPQSLADVAVSPDGRLLAVTSNCVTTCVPLNAVTFFDIATGQQIGQVTQSSPASRASPETSGNSRGMAMEAVSGSSERPTRMAEAAERLSELTAKSSHTSRTIGAFRPGPHRGGIWRTVRLRLDACARAVGRSA